MGNGRIIKRENKFTQVSNSALRDEDLGLRAVGLYGKINSYLTIPDWTLYKSFLMNQCKEGKKAFNSAWNELKDSGWLIQHKIKGENGRFYYEYELLDEKKPQPQKGYLEEEETTTPFCTPGECTPTNCTSAICTPAKGGPILTQKVTKTLSTNTDDTNTNTHKEQARAQLQENKQENLLCVDTSLTLKQLQREIQIVVGAVVGIPTLERLIHSVGKDRLCYHLAHWPIHRKNQSKKGAGYFITVVENDIEPIEPEKKQRQYYGSNQKPQRDNFEQREYTDEEFESFYANLVE